MANIPEKLADLPERYPSRRRYLVGVSGGVDSVVLLHALHALGYGKLIVCHLNHGLRGRASGGDATFVGKLGERLGYEVEVEKTEVGKLAKQTKRSIETAARDARLAFFSAVAKRRRCREVFLGHHADDQVETVLMRLFRGATTRGLAGMREKSAIGTLKLIRPLLGTWRSEIEAWAGAQGMVHREDASNTDTAHLRNEMRQRVIPFLNDSTGRDIRDAIARASEVYREEDALMEQLVEACDCAGDQTGTLSAAKLRRQPIALQRRVFARFLKELGVNDVGFVEVERVRELITPGADVAKVNLPGGRFARRRSGVVFVE